MSNSINSGPAYTAADALNDALIKAGVTHVFLNSGTDYPPIVESWAKAKAQGRQTPEIIISPHEYAAISAAQGFAQVTGRPQAVYVHVDVGTQNLGGGIHNAFRSRTPMFVLAGLSPYTIEGELKGSRDSHIHFLQNAADQAGIVRGYVKLNLELKSGKNMQQMVYRALQIAKSEPCGPVYMAAPREPLEEEGVEIDADMRLWGPIEPAGLSDESLRTLIGALLKAEKPLIITSYLGRNKEGVAELARLSKMLAIPVSEPYLPTYMNLPADHPYHIGALAQSLLEEADLVLVIDCDMPWTPSLGGPREGCRRFYLDCDPLKEDIPVWYIPSESIMKADSLTALRQLNAGIESVLESVRPDLVTARRLRVEKLRESLMKQREAAEKQQPEMTSGFVAACVREVVDNDTVILNEAITNGGAVYNHIPRVRPGTFFTSGGSSLGWACGAAFGMKLACPDRDVVAMVGDGSYIFSVPTAVYWMARRYDAPFMTVIFNNGGWNAPKFSVIGQHPDGFAAKGNEFWSRFDQPARLDLIAEAAGGAFAKLVERPEDLRQALHEGMEAVRSGVCAVINVLMPTV